MKKIYVFLMIILLGLTVGCKKDNKVKILLPDGIPSIALGGIFDDEDVDVTIVTGADLLTAALVKNDYDLIVAPLTAGAKLYLKQTSSYLVDSIITFGNTYLVKKGTEEINISDLNGKTIYAYGQNNTPDIVLSTFLKANNINCNVEYEASVNDVFSNHFSLNEDNYYLLAEPVLSNIQVKQNKDIVILDLQEALKSTIDMIPQAAIFVKENTKQVKAIINKIKNNIESLNNNSSEYVDKLLTLNSEIYPTFSKLGRNVLIHAIPYSQINFANAYDNKETINKFFELINTNNPNILQNKEVDDAFYNK